MKHPYAIALDVGTSKHNHTGSWRTQRPVYVDRLPPCNAACPAGEDIQGWLAHAEAGDYEAAWRALTANNPLPAIMGRVCYHPCETACNRAAIDEALKAREEGKSTTILFNLSGHGHFDMQAYTDYFAGKLVDMDYDPKALEDSLAHLPKVAAE